MKIILKLSLLLILITQSFGAKYTHDDFHKDITEIESEMKNMSNKLIIIETKVENYDSTTKKILDKDYTLAKIIENLSYGAYIMIVLVIGFFIWFCQFIGRSVTKLEDNYHGKYSDLESRYNNKFQALEEKADRIITKALSTPSSSKEEASTNSTDPF
ncbi:MAG: hypothetical protein C0628_04425 [Sulfurimonas sp.]|nr:MAG: hypothetical protein C0628_04425 [Sulfurimonas sp.]